MFGEGVEKTMTSSKPRFFPVLLDGEFLYGAITRWAVTQSAVPKIQPIDSRKVKTKNATVDISGKWIEVVSTMTSVDFTQSGSVLEKATQLPLYNTFFNERRPLTYALPGEYAVATETAHSFLRYCPVCLKESVSTSGLGFWKTLHQSPLLLRCPFHNTRLIAYQKATAEFRRPYLLEINGITDLWHEEACSIDALTDFQQWLETLALNKKLYQCRGLAKSIIQHLTTLLGTPDDIRQARKRNTKQVDFDTSAFAYKVRQAGYEAFLKRGTRSINEIKRDPKFSLTQILSHRKRYSPVFYLLLAWVFLGPGFIESQTIEHNESKCA